MARYKPIDLSPKLITVDFPRQILPGSCEYALCYSMDHERDLSEFEHRVRNDEGGAPAYAPALLLKMVPSPMREGWGVPAPSKVLASRMSSLWRSAVVPLLISLL
jgi:hypothetical protein